MTRLLRLLCLALALLVVFGAGAGAPAAQAGANDPRTCADKAFTIAASKTITCKFARRWTRRLHATKSGPAGWRCSSNNDFRVSGTCSLRRNPSRIFGFTVRS